MTADIEIVRDKTEKSEEEVIQLYDSFKEQFPKGKIFKKSEQNICFPRLKLVFCSDFSKFYPSQSDIAQYADQIFRWQARLIDNKVQCNVAIYQTIGPIDLWQGRIL